MSEIKDKVQEIFDDLKGRIRNPLVLSFILVWLLYHWRFVYILLTMGQFSVDERVDALNRYIVEHDGTIGMLWIPLAWSLVSLALYYLLAIIGQGIKIFFGKRLNAHLLAKADMGNYALKSELDTKERILKRTSDDLVKANSIIVNFNTQKEEIEVKLKKAEESHGRAISENERLSGNMRASDNYIKQYKHTLLYLLARTKNITSPAVDHDIVKDHFRPISGNWEAISGMHISDGSGSVKNYYIKDNEVSNRDGTVIGSVQELIFDRKNYILSFKIKHNDQANQSQFHIIRVNEDEWVGFQDSSFVQFKRYKD
jgi:hypothetical protein